MAAKVRLDQVLVLRGLFPSREQAQGAILAGRVRVGGVPATKAGMPVPEDAVVELADAGPAYASRGGHKLVGALDAFGVAVEGRRVLDSGASTGGFTDVLLRRGAARVYAVDVGYGQLAWELRNDPRVVVRERTNLRHATPEALFGADPAPDLATLDLSFISLTKVLPAVRALLSPPREVVALVKPQFEAGKRLVGSRGVVRDPAVHTDVLEAVARAARELGWSVQGMTHSPLKGPEGNVEFWLHLAEGADREVDAAEVVARAHRELA